MTPVNITWPKVTHLCSEQGEHTLIRFTYYKNQCTQFYLDTDKEEAIARFTKKMNQRHPFEIQQEGWDAIGIIIPFNNNEAWLGEGNLFEGMDEYFTNMLLKNFQPKN